MKRALAVLLVLTLTAGCFSAALADRTITITFTGDVTLGSEEIKKNQPDSFVKTAEREGYEYFFRNVKDLFLQDDLTVVNLEGVLSDSANMENTGKAYRFRGPKDYARILTMSSIEACGISNNHTKDFGSQGYKNTVAALEENGLGYFGNNDYYYVFEKDGIKIAFFALVSTIVWNSRKWGRETVDRLKAEEGINAVVVCIHAGTEYDPHRHPKQVEYAQLAFKHFDADLVIMHHPHVLQGIDVMNDRYVCYSLGNFCFGGNAQVRALETMAVQADLVFADDGTYKGQQLRLYPAHISSSATAAGDANNFQPCFVTGDDALAVLQLVQNDTAFDLGLYDEEAGYLALPYLPAGSPGDGNQSEE